MKTLVSIVAGVWALALFSLLTSGCGGKQDLEKALDTSVVIIDRAEPCFKGMKDDQDRACAGDAACLAKVKEHWAPIADALDAYHAFLCGISPNAEGC